MSLLQSSWFVAADNVIAFSDDFVLLRGTTWIRSKFESKGPHSWSKAITAVV